MCLSMSFSQLCIESLSMPSHTGINLSGDVCHHVQWDLKLLLGSAHLGSCCQEQWAAHVQEISSLPFDRLYGRKMWIFTKQTFSTVFTLHRESFWHSPCMRAFHSSCLSKIKICQSIFEPFEQEHVFESVVWSYLS